MRIHTRRAIMAAFVITVVSAGAYAVAQGITGFEGYWGSRYSSVSTRGESVAAVQDRGRATAPLNATALANAERRNRLQPTDPRSRLVHWNKIAIDASGVDHMPVAPGENRVFGEQLGPGRASLAIAVVQIAIADAMNAIYGRWESYASLPPAPSGASVDAAIAQAAHDALVAMFPSQAATFDTALAEDLAQITATGKEDGLALGRSAAAAILAMRVGDRSDARDPRMGENFHASEEAGMWRQDPISRIPVALGASWGHVKPLVLRSGSQFRALPPPAMHTREYAQAYNEAKRLGGDGVITPTERTAEQTAIGIFWAYDGTPSLCAPPRLYNQVILTVADQMHTSFLDLTRLLAVANVAMADAGIAIWESKFLYQLWRPVTAIREADEGTGPTGHGDGNAATIGDPTFTPLGAPASNLAGPDFTPPFPTYPSGHAGFGGALFEVLRRFYGRDDVAFTFMSDEFNGTTRGTDGKLRPEQPRHFTSFSQAEEENGQSRIYLGIHWSFDKTEGIAQGRQVADYVVRNAFQPRDR